MMSAFRHSMMLVIAGFVLLSAASPAMATGMLFTADGTVSGMDILGMSHDLGEGPFQIKVKLDQADQIPDPGSPPGFEQFSDAFRNFEIRLPMLGLKLGGRTSDNMATTDRNFNFDEIRFGVSDCINDHCGIPASTLGNTVDLGFEGMSLRFQLSPGTLPTGFSTLRELERYVDGIDAANTSSLVNIIYVDANLISLSAGSTTGSDVIAMGNGDMPDIRYLQILGTITDVRIVPEPASILILLIGCCIWSGPRVFRRCGRR